MTETGTDQLCPACKAVPLYSLFTGPRKEGHGDPVEYTMIGTLQQVWTNAKCPLCRMVKRVVSQNFELFEDLSAICAPSDIRVQLMPERVDAQSDMRFENDQTQKLL